MATSPGPTRASRIFAALVKGKQATWATRLGISEPYVSKIASGDRTPSEALQAAIYEAGGPAPADWAIGARDPDDDSRKPPVIVDEVRASPDTTKEAANRMATQVVRTMAEAEQIEDIEARARVLSNCVKMITALGELTGTTVTERQIINSPVWRRIYETMCDAIAAQPYGTEAIKLMIDALETLDNG